MHDPSDSRLRPLPPLDAALVVRPAGARSPSLPPEICETALLKRVRRVSRLFTLSTVCSLILIGLCEYIAAPVLGLFLDLFGLTQYPALMEVADELFLIGLYFVAFLFPYMLYAQMTGFRLRLIPRRRVHPPVLLSCTGLAMGASHVGLILTAVLLAMASVVGLYPPDLPIYFPQSPVALILMLINLTVLPAIIEELIYRGIVLHSLRPFGNVPAVLISSLFFGLMHRNMLQFPHAFVLGLALGYLVIQTGSIYTGIFIHFVNNLIASLLSLAVEHLDPFAAGLLSTGQFVLYLAAAVAALVYFAGVRRVSWRMPASASGTPPPAKVLSVFFKNAPMVVLLGLFIFSLWASYS